MNRNKLITHHLNSSLTIHVN